MNTNSLRTLSGYLYIPVANKNSDCQHHAIINIHRTHAVANV